MVKSPAVEVLSEPKSKITTLGSPAASSLKIIAPRAVTVAVDHVVSAKSVRAVVELVEGVTLVRVLPFAVYPVPVTSFVAVYAVVAAVKDAVFVYIAILKVLPDEFVKSCVAVISSALNEVHMKFPVKAIYIFLIASASCGWPASLIALYIVVLSLLIASCI